MSFAAKMANLVKSLIKKYFVQFMKFTAVGVLNTVISLSVYYGLLFHGVYYIASGAASFSVGVLNAYFWNKRFVFKSDAAGGQALVRIYMSYGLTFVLGTGLLYLQVEFLRVSEYVAPLLNVFVTTPINFFLNRFFVFRP